MDAEVTLFSKPEELIAWADTFDILLNPSIEDAAILLNYTIPLTNYLLLELYKLHYVTYQFLIFSRLIYYIGSNYH